MNTQVPDPLFDYEPNKEWLRDRDMRMIATHGYTAHAVLIQTTETKSEVEQAMKRTLVVSPGPDSFRVISISDFAWPSAVSSDDDLEHWLEARTDWQEWRAGH
ncbi:MAG TPA: hypothetical protein VK846_17870 [Candidatus Limnocylindria bacterium]|nr:hypothetical protein [Candidatus Limnocylindria bacterium]